VIAILGGGVVGAAVARGLALAGRRDVVVFDPRQPGEGSTGRAMGGFRLQHGSALNIELARRSRPYFSERADRVRFRPNGYLYLAETEEMAAELGRRALFQESCGVPVDHPDPTNLVPGIRVDDVKAANYCAHDGVYMPALVLQSLLEEGRAAGVDFRYGAAAAASDLAGAEAIVVAAGTWSREVGATLGVRLAVEPLERGVWFTGPFDWLPDTIPMTLDAGSGYHFRERDGRLLVMGPGDQHQWNHYREWLHLRLPAAAVAEPESHWTGAYEVTFDHHALVGATERPGVWACCGFSGHGVMQSPIVGECLAAMITGAVPPLDISALNPLRTSPLVDTTQL